VAAVKKEIVALFDELASDADAGASENLFLARGALGYVGDPMEFRFSSIYATQHPSAKNELIHDYVEEYSRLPHSRLRRPLTTKEADWLRDEANKLLKEERAYIKAALSAREPKSGRQLDAEIADALKKPRRTR
jgi:hypothetical protein